MKLYSMMPRDCSGKVRWLLYEMGIQFEEVLLDWKKGDLSSTSFLSKNPIGQVPVLEDGPVTIYESHAIIAYLADKYIEKGFAPALTDFTQRALYYQWLFFSTAIAEEFFSKHRILGDLSEEHKKEWTEYVQEKVQRTMSTVEAQLKNQDYILGKFSAVDTSLGYALGSVAKEPFFNDYPKTGAYMERLKAREACARSEMFKLVP